jgi:2-polyprenyl-6-methoxyphenol hydroxylase-like FAD-dependent oxidoreductase
VKVVVVGGGIGGLAASIALRRAGIESVVVEQASEIREVGAGITLWTNATKALARLGLADAVRAAATPLERGEIRDWRGRVLVVTPVGDVGRRLGSPSVCLHRADLLRVLVDGAGRDLVRLGERCVGVEEDERGATALLEGGGRERGEALVGADGIRSVVRAALFGDEPPRYSGYTCWRAVIEMAGDAVPLGHAFESWGAGARFGVARIDARRAYWFASVNAPPGGRDADAKRELHLRFGRWHEPIPSVIAASRADAISRLDVFDRPPARRWGRGRVTLLGDAAHATTPNLGQGACLAIEDAVALARRLADADDVPAALRAYEAERRPRAAAITRRSRRLGWIGQRESAVARGVRDRLMRLVPAAAMTRAYESNVEWEP